MQGGMLDIGIAEVDRWCRRYLGSAVAEIAFRAGYLSTVLGLRLDSGRAVVLKVRPPAPRLRGCATVHRKLFEKRFPCPEPLVELTPLGPWVASAEAMVTGGEPLPSTGRSPAPFAGALARLVALSPLPVEVPALDPPLSWTGPDPSQEHLWPWPDDLDIDLNAAGGPGWIDEAGRAARLRLDSAAGQAVVGHADWYTANIRWAGDDLFVVWDWDSVISATEPVVAGLAAAVYPATRAGTEATIGETEGFLEAYCEARGRPFSTDEIQQAWAAGLWNRSFDAKKQFAAEGRPLSLTEGEAVERRLRAGVA